MPPPRNSVNQRSRGTSDRGTANNTGTQRQPTAERQWQETHSQGAINRISSRHFVLWNFDIDSWTLKPEHEDFLRREFGNSMVLLAVGRISLIGRASDSTPALPMTNQILGRNRATSVQQFLARLPNFNRVHQARSQPIARLPSGAVLREPNQPFRLADRIRVRSRGDSSPLEHGDSGRRNAYNRSVEIIIPQRSRQCEFPVDRLPFNSVVKDLVRRFVNENMDQVRNGTPRTGRIRGGIQDIFVKMCCASSRPLGVMLLLPENRSFFETLRRRGVNLGMSSSSWVRVCRATNNRMINLIRANPCQSLQRTRNIFRRGQHAFFRQFMESLAGVAMPYSNFPTIIDYVWRNYDLRGGFLAVPHDPSTSWHEALRRTVGLEGER